MATFVAAARARCRSDRSAVAVLWRWRAVPGLPRRDSHDGALRVTVVLHPALTGCWPVPRRGC